MPTSSPAAPNQGFPGAASGFSRSTTCWGGKESKLAAIWRMVARSRNGLGVAASLATAAKLAHRLVLLALLEGDAAPHHRGCGARARAVVFRQRNQLLVGGGEAALIDPVDRHGQLLAAFAGLPDAGVVPEHVAGETGEAQHDYRADQPPPSA